MPNIPHPKANDGTQVHVSFAGGGVVVSRRKVPAKHQDLVKLQNEVGVNLPLLRSLVEAHKLASYHRHDLELPETLRRAAAEAVAAVETLVKLHATYARKAALSGSALNEKLVASQGALEMAKTASPKLRKKDDLKERTAFLDDLTMILKRAGQEQQRYASQQVTALAEAERALENIHHNARKQEAAAKEANLKRAAKAKKGHKPSPAIVLPPLEEGSLPEADSPTPL